MNKDKIGQLQLELSQHQIREDEAAKFAEAKIITLEAEKDSENTLKEEVEQQLRRTTAQYEEISKQYR